MKKDHTGKARHFDPVGTTDQSHHAVSGGWRGEEGESEDAESVHCC